MMKTLGKNYKLKLKFNDADGISIRISGDMYEVRVVENIQKKLSNGHRIY